MRGVQWHCGGGMPEAWDGVYVRASARCLLLFIYTLFLWPKVILSLFLASSNKRLHSVFCGPRPPLTRIQRAQVSVLLQRGELVLLG